MLRRRVGGDGERCEVRGLLAGGSGGSGRRGSHQAVGDGDNLSLAVVACSKGAAVDSSLAAAMCRRRRGSVSNTQHRQGQLKHGSGKYFILQDPYLISTYKCLPDHHGF